MKALHESFTANFIISILWMVYLVLLDSLLGIGIPMTLVYLAGFIRIWYIFFGVYDETKIDRNRFVG